MHFPVVLVLMFGELSLAAPAPAPVVTVMVQVQRWGVVGAQRVVDQVLLNGVSLTGTSQEVHGILETISADARLPADISVNQTSVLSNHTVLRSRECILEGSQLHWSDRVFCDGTVYLTLEHTDTWTAVVPQALALKVLWDQEGQRTRTDRIRLQEGCVKLMRELKLSEEHTAPGMPLPAVLIPVFAILALVGLMIICVFLTKYQGLRHPGGVLGSIIHYPKDMKEMAPEVKGSGYHTLSFKAPAD